MNYRLGIFGFLALKELSAVDTRGVSGNYGITDQILALRWVRTHIAAFGGDPSRVTLLGHSSGASNIFALLSSPASYLDGALLFNGAIAVSGSTHLSMNRTVKEAQDRRLWLPRTPCAHTVSTQLVRCLHSADARGLIASIPGSYCRTRHIVKYAPTTTSPLL